MGQEPFRLMPAMRPSDYKTYKILAPRRTHFGPASCEDVECPAYAKGWSTLIDESTELGKKQAHYIRKMSGRGFTESRTSAGLTDFVFRPGQPCFRQHVYRNELPAIFKVEGGDFRGNPLGVPSVTHTKPDFWVEDFAEHQENVKSTLERG
jgi:hypothetical protein